MVKLGVKVIPEPEFKVLLLADNITLVGRIDFIQVSYHSNLFNFLINPPRENLSWS